MISREQAARLIAAHEKVSECMRAVLKRDRVSKEAMWDRIENLGRAKRAFAEMVAQLTDSEGP